MEEKYKIMREAMRHARMSVWEMVFILGILVIVACWVIAIVYGVIWLISKAF